MYKARVDGLAVAVKVQRPDLLAGAALDFFVARGIADSISRLSRSSGFFGGRLVVRSDLVAAVDEYGSRLFEELDYRKEVGLGGASGLVVGRALCFAMHGNRGSRAGRALSGKSVACWS